MMAACHPFERVEAFIDSCVRLDEEERSVLWLFAWLVESPLLSPRNLADGTSDDDHALVSLVAAFAPEEGERLGEVESTSKDSILSTAQVPLRYPTGQHTETAVEFAIDPAKLHEAFAADLSPEQTAVMAATQRPFAEAAFSEPSGPPAWKSRPSWAVVATGDKAAGADVIRSQAERAGATITEVEGSHVIMISQPETVAEVILTAAASVRRSTAAAAG